MVKIMNTENNYENIPLHKKSRQERLDQYASDYRTNQLELERIKVTLEYLREQILAEFTEDDCEIEIPFEERCSTARSREIFNSLNTLFNRILAFSAIYRFTCQS